MNILAELVAIAIVWLSGQALCQFGVVLERHPKVEAVQPRTVVRTARPTAVNSVNSIDCPERLRSAAQA